MSKVIQVRNVPDEVHASLVEGAARAGKSLTRFVNDALAEAAYRLESAAHNRRVIETSQAEFASLDVSRGDTRRVIDEARAERDRELDGGAAHGRSA